MRTLLLTVYIVHPPLIYMYLLFHLCIRPAEQCRGTSARVRSQATVPHRLGAAPSTPTSTSTSTIEERDCDVAAAEACDRPFGSSTCHGTTSRPHNPSQSSPPTTTVAAARQTSARTHHCLRGKQCQRIIIKICQHIMNIVCFVLFFVCFCVHRLN